jgi:hypothetical protein
VRTHWSDWGCRDSVYAVLLPAPGLRLDFIYLTLDLLAKEPTARPSLDSILARLNHILQKQQKDAARAAHTPKSAVPADANTRHSPEKAPLYE